MTSHLARAKWMAEHGYRDLLRGGTSDRLSPLPTAADKTSFLTNVAVTSSHRRIARIIVSPVTLYGDNDAIASF